MIHKISSRANAGALWLLALCYFLFVFCSLAVIGLMPNVSGDLGSTSAQAALLVTSFSMSFMLVALFAPLFSIRFAAKATLIVGLAGMSVGATMLALAPGLGWANAARMLQGGSAALIGPTVSIIAVRISTDSSVGRALGFVFGGSTVAIVSGVPLASWLAEWVSWRTIYVGIALAGCALIALIMMTLPKVFPDSKSGDGFGHYISAMKSKAIICALMSTVLRMAAQFTCYTVIAVLVVDYLGLPPGSVALVLVVLGAAGIVSNLLAALGSDRWGTITMLRVAGIALLCAYVGLLLSPYCGQSCAWGMLVIWGVAGLLPYAPQQKFLSDHPDKAASSVALSLNSASVYAGMAGGSLLAALVYTRWGLEFTIWLSLLLTMLSMVTSELSFLARK